MINITDLKIGDCVHYQPEHFQDDEWENGIVKAIREGKTDGVWVVYYCGGDWENFQDYTGALTNLRDLKLNWRAKDEETKAIAKNIGLNYDKL